MRFIKQAVLAILLGVLTIQPAIAQQSPTIIRDAEIEDMLQEWMDPIFKAANISPDNVKIILVQDSMINAFVAGGSNIFIYTGLLERSQSPGEVIGVLSHELGHISGGHLIGTRGALERASYESILGSILGIGAAIVTGNGQAASAISVGTSTIAQRNFFSYSRLNESSADQAAIGYLEKAGINPSGLISFFHTLQSEELLPVDKQVQYVRTHPLTSDRISFLQTRFENSAYKNTSLPPKWVEQHARMKAKLLAFITPGRVQWEYSDNDKSMPARYARAIAAYRQNKIEDAVEQINALLKEEPKNPYFLELKGQVLMDFGRIEEAIPFYRQSVEILNDAPLIRMALGHALLETGDPGNSKEAISHLERVLKEEPRSSQTHRLLATAYGKNGNETLAKLHLAEEALMQGRKDYAVRLASAVLENAEENSREKLQAKDILDYIENKKDQ